MQTANPHRRDQHPGDCRDSGQPEMTQRGHKTADRAADNPDKRAGQILLPADRPMTSVVPVTQRNLLTTTPTDGIIRQCPSASGNLLLADRHQLGRALSDSRYFWYFCALL